MAKSKKDNSVRHYNHKDSVMLISISTIVQNLIRHKPELAAKRQSWGGSYFTDLEAKIETVVQTYLGVKSSAELTTASATLGALQATALTQLYEYRVQVIADFKTDKERQEALLKLLGFADYYVDAYRKHSQDALVDLLFTLKQNATPQIQAELAAKGIDQSRMDNLLLLADQVKDSNITQETFKVSKKELTAKAIIAFNEIYTEVTSAGQVAAAFLKDDKVATEGFRYSKLAKAQTAALKAAKQTPPPPPPNA